jgi:hypothetical protein
MRRHGSESFFVVGEGLLGETVGGRERTLAPALEAAAPPFRFSRMGPRGTKRQLGDAILRKVGNAMAVGGGGASGVPAGFTYLGQFVDHDLTFDRTSVMLGDRVSPSDLLQARSPSLDLDSLYGAGPTEPGSGRFYRADGLHLKTGRTEATDGFPDMDDFDLPRGRGDTPEERRSAIIPDPRNDENLAVAQTHLAFIRFHNRVVDTQLDGVPPAQRFAVAREIVTKHYQWMLRTDYLPQICAKSVVNDVFANGRRAFEVGATPTDVPTMPIEFSVAAFRLGHSMVRASYDWNKVFRDGGGTLDLLFTFSAGGGDLFGGERLPSNWIADFRRLYDFGEAGRADLAAPEERSNRAMRIDTRLTDPLKTLPMFEKDEQNNLAIRNLMRAKMVTLATGQQMARFLANRGVAIDRPTSAEIREGQNGASLDDLTKTQRSAFVADTPLWFYVLRESELGRGKLRSVGARIVAETFHRAMEGSEASIVRDTAWRPTLGPDSDTFRMVDLLLFAFEGKKKLLAPLG